MVEVEVEELEVQGVVMVSRLLPPPDSVVAGGPECEMLARCMGTTWLTGALVSGG